jgi:NAD(P)-dependent dehydrogenase (short-subunit alcohol dehydrogenase family)
MSMKNKRILVIGGASGIGAAGVRALNDAGARVVLGDLNPPSEELGAELFCPVDIGRDEQLLSIVGKANESLGGLDGVWNNAGVCHVGSVETMSLDGFDLCFRLNVRANAVLARAVIPILRAGGGGSILFTASAAGVMVEQSTLPYGVTKSALVTMTRQLALEYAKAGIRVNALCPGWVDTPFNKPAWDAFGGRDAFLEKVPPTIPLSRMGTVEEMGAVVRFLLSDDARFFTGQAIVPDGGQGLECGGTR